MVSLDLVRLSRPSGAVCWDHPQSFCSIPCLGPPWTQSISQNSGGGTLNRESKPIPTLARSTTRGFQRSAGGEPPGQLSWRVMGLLSSTPWRHTRQRWVCRHPEEFTSLRTPGSPIPWGEAAFHPGDLAGRVVSSGLGLQWPEAGPPFPDGRGKPGCGSESAESQPPPDRP